MTIDYIISDTNAAFVRPQGYRYPVGLPTFVILGNTSVDEFTSSNTWVAPSVTEVEVLVVAGGGGAAGYWGGGGGAGGLVYSSNFPVNPGTTYTITIGAGGSAGTTPFPAGFVRNSNGVNSSITYTGATPFSNSVAVGGGASGGYSNPASSGVQYGCSGGSGGGGSVGDGFGIVGNIPATGIPGQGNPGGTGNPSTVLSCGGGGGAGAAGANASPSGGGNGGDGLEYSISGSPVYYAGGGGGAASPTPTGGTGGLGGGGAAGGASAGVAGTANRGGGGGGSGPHPSTGSGGSGIIIIKSIEQTINYIID